MKTRACAASAAVAVSLVLCWAAAASAQVPPLVVVFPDLLPAQASAATQEKQNPPPQPKGHEGHVMPPQRPPDLPPITDEDRRAAFPDVDGHTVHDRTIQYFVLADQLEWQRGNGNAGSWDTRAWIGGDLNRFWFRSEGLVDGDRVASTQHHALYGRAFARWWDLVGGIRQDVRPGPAQTWAAFGIQGLAPYWFEVQATAYIGAEGRTHFRVETEYELLVTNRVILQPLVEMEVYGKEDREHGFGAGLATLDAGLRLRYEIRRELAPYAGVTWDWKFGDTAAIAEEKGERVSGVRFTLGLRTWF